MRRMWTLTALLTTSIVGTSVALLGQQQVDQKPLAFEVASVKPNTSGDPFDWGISGFGTSGPTPSQFTAKNAALDRIIAIGFGLRDEQMINLPGWTHTERFDIVAKYPDGTAFNAQDEAGMLRSLLAERFKLHTHRETRELPVYDLVLARRDHRLGPSLRLSTETSRVSPPAQGLIQAQAAPIGLLVLILSPMVQRLVVDRTGLTGHYDFELRWTSDGPAASSPSATAGNPSLFTAVEEQLGLKLESTTGPVDVVVIDHVERPTPD